MKKARIIFSTNQAFGSRVIRLVTWSDYSHCDILNPNAKVSTIIGATPTLGVAEYSFEERVSHSTKWALYEVNVDANQVWSYAKTQLGKKYDWLGCLGIAIQRDWQEPDKWFCSELVAKAVLEAGTALINTTVRLNRVTPQMLLSSPLLGSPLKASPAAA